MRKFTKPGGYVRRQICDYVGLVESATPLVFADALVKIRERFGCSDWGGFSIELERASGVKIATGTLQHLAPSYRRTSGPHGDVIWLMEASGVLEFANGEPVTAAALLDTFYGRRDADGNRLS